MKRVSERWSIEMENMLPPSVNMLFHHGRQIFIFFYFFSFTHISNLKRLVKETSTKYFVNAFMLKTKLTKTNDYLVRKTIDQYFFFLSLSLVYQFFACLSKAFSSSHVHFVRLIICASF